MAKRTSWSNREVNVLVAAIIAATAIGTTVQGSLSKDAGWPWWAADLTAIPVVTVIAVVVALIGLPRARRRDARR